jgi:hypothetical protein
LSGARIIEAIAGATSTPAVGSTVARIRLQKFLASFPMYASLVILVAVLTVGFPGHLNRVSVSIRFVAILDP